MLAAEERMNPEDAVQSVLDYHRKTNHSVESVRAGNISLDFSILPRLYKLYRRAEALPLPEESAPSDVPALEAIAGDAPTRDGAPTLEDVAALLKLSAGITKWLKVPNGSMAFRAASCTGALYHIELYLVCGDLPGLPAGVYQYGAQDNALRRVRSGDYRGALVAATAGTRRWHRRPCPLSTRVYSGGTRGSTRAARTGTPIGTAAPSLRIRCRSRRRGACRRRWSQVSRTTP